MTERQEMAITAAIKGIRSARRDLSANPDATMRRIFREMYVDGIRYSGAGGIAYMACVVIYWNDHGKPEHVLPDVD